MNNRIVGRRIGVTLVELLIVIAIIGMLAQLLMPAVGASRESARRIQCTNNLRQLSMGCLLHENTFGRFPSAGWGLTWIPDPDEGSGPNQPGGWTYTILPYIEQSYLRDLGRGASDEQSRMAHLELTTTPVSTYYCPSRRPARIYPGFDVGIYHYLDADVENERHLAKTDYAANSGDFFTGLWSESEDQLARYKDISTENYTGVIYHSSKVEARQIVDGMSKTFLVGEKAAWPAFYETNEDDGDAYSLYVGAHPTNCRWTRVTPSTTPFPPSYDSSTPIEEWHSARFGSAHASGCNMALCDGSIDFVDYGIDADIFRWLGNREDSMKRINYDLSSEGEPIIEPL